MPAHRSASLRMQIQIMIKGRTKYHRENKRELMFRPCPVTIARTYNTTLYAISTRTSRKHATPTNTHTHTHIALAHTSCCASGTGAKLRGSNACLFAHAFSGRRIGLAKYSRVPSNSFREEGHEKRRKKTCFLNQSLFEIPGTVTKRVKRLR